MDQKPGIDDIALTQAYGGFQALAAVLVQSKPQSDEVVFGVRALLESKSAETVSHQYLLNLLQVIS